MGQLSKSEFARVQRGAVARGIEFNVTHEYLWELFQSQGGKCALTGWDLALQATTRRLHHRASLDRIDSDRGYVPGNVHWVVKEVNLAKHTQSQAEFIEMCRAVVAQADSKS